ncbi:MAG: glycosyltransferase family 4 protein [Bacteroidota bacterium]
MKILFVSSGNHKDFNIAPFIKRQAESLEQNGHEVKFFTVQNKGITGYLKNIGNLKKTIKSDQFDIIHAHYTFNGLLALLTLTKKPIVVSYMGADTYGSYNRKGQIKPSSYINILIAIIIQPFINGIIVKSPNLKKRIFFNRKAYLIPNGININYFKNIGKEKARKYLNLKMESKVILFLGDKTNKRKNFHLISEAFKQVEAFKNLNLLAPYPVEPKKIIYYYNAADVLALSSYDEGSPNVIKEAMACNKPIVSTNVGDVEWLFGNTEGCYLSDFNPENVAKQLEKAICFSETKGETKGRDRIIELKLDASSVAKKITEVYREVLKQKET